MIPCARHHWTILFLSSKTRSGVPYSFSHSPLMSMSDLKSPAFRILKGQSSGCLRCFDSHSFVFAITRSLLPVQISTLCREIASVSSSVIISEMGTSESHASKKAFHFSVEVSNSCSRIYWRWLVSASVSSKSKTINIRNSFQFPVFSFQLKRFAGLWVNCITRWV